MQADSSQVAGSGEVTWSSQAAKTAYVLGLTTTSETVDQFGGFYAPGVVDPPPVAKRCGSDTMMLAYPLRRS